ncbi:hypothetical protein N7539_002661 [Penicillium diatomitis]|uniref:Mid2 domain-containing protein n=1 Tax=Penicillium diatomitis TaxID=2819901 RepID=A0A9W9XF25_9EURO|nr:uncharacterized protein N7539_002661 [Penicillium diatomitis]KAJ5491094.1 hypothetical protein N7539_002661 [Penicillium diatomitis]
MPSSTQSAAAPLTTVFSPPASCTNVQQVSSECQKDCKNLYNIVQITDSNCFPSQWATTATWFSPGIYCPKGYTVADSHTVTSGLQLTETQARCCPSGYTMATDLAQAWWTAEPCTKVSAVTTTLNFTVYSATGASPTTTSEMVIRGPIIHAYPVELRWQSSDSAALGSGSTTASAVPTFTDATTTKTSASTTGPTSSATSPSTAPPSSDGAHGSSGLSTGAKAGIGIGVAAAVIIILALLFCLWRRRKGSASSASPSKERKVSLGNAQDDVYGEIPVRQVPGHKPVELPTRATGWSEELHGQSHPAPSELEAGQAGYDSPMTAKYR